MTKTRKLNGGTIYQRASDGLWCAAVEMEPVDGKRRKRVVASKDRAVVEARLLEMNPAVRASGLRSRAMAMREARAIATHKPSEWHAKVRASPNFCRYCDTALNGFNQVKDHMIAVEVGGSDGIDNVQPICWECNMDKGKTPHDVFVYRGQKPRPFSVLPIRRKDYERGQAVSRAWLERNK
jgi:hypothetical protein